VPERRDREDPATERRRWNRKVHYALCHLPARLAVHHVTNRAKIRVGIHEAVIAGARVEQKDPNWRADYRATRPKVERKLGHLMRRRHGEGARDARETTGCSRLQSSRCRSQPCTPRKLEVRSIEGGGWMMPDDKRWRPMASTRAPRGRRSLRVGLVRDIFDTVTRSKECLLNNFQLPASHIEPCSTPGT